MYNPLRLTNTTPSRALARTSFDLAGVTTATDRRLDQITEILRAEIKRNKWDLVIDEKAICVRMVELMHQERFFGKSHAQTDAMLDKISQLKFLKRSILESPERSFRENTAKVLEIDKQLAEQNKGKYAKYFSRGTWDLSSYKSGSLLCREYATAASAIMHRLGIQNDYCYGFTQIGLDGRVAFHAFVQSRVTGNIIEATTTKSCYAENLNGALICKGEIVKIGVNHQTKKGEDLNLKSISYYGAGKISPIQIVQSGLFLKGDYLESVIRQNVKAASDASFKSRDDYNIYETLGAIRGQFRQGVSKGVTTIPFSFGAGENVFQTTIKLPKTHSEKEKAQVVEDVVEKIKVALKRADTNHDGRIQPSEQKAMVQALRAEFLPKQNLRADKARL